MNLDAHPQQGLTALLRQHLRDLARRPGRRKPDAKPAFDRAKLRAEMKVRRLGQAIAAAGSAKERFEAGMMARVNAAFDAIRNSK